MAESQCAAGVVLPARPGLPDGTEQQMVAVTERVSIEALRRAIEARDSRVLARFYADNAVLEVIDQDHPPRQPRAYRGRAAITAYLDQVCLRDMTHAVEAVVGDGNRLAFTQRCVYRNGASVFSASMVELRDGRIVHQVQVQAWDELPRAPTRVEPGL